MFPWVNYSVFKPLKTSFHSSREGLELSSLICQGLHLESNGLLLGKNWVCREISCLTLPHFETLSFSARTWKEMKNWRKSTHIARTVSCWSALTLKKVRISAPRLPWLYLEIQTTARVIQRLQYFWGGLTEIWPSTHYRSKKNNHDGTCQSFLMRTKGKGNKNITPFAEWTIQVLVSEEYLTSLTSNANTECISGTSCVKCFLQKRKKKGISTKQWWCLLVVVLKKKEQTKQNEASLLLELRR